MERENLIEGEMELFLVVGRFIFGWLAGAVVNLLADQLPTLRKAGRPVCDQCDRVIPWVQFVCLEDCHICRHPRTARSFLIQWFLAFAFALLNYWLPSRLYALEACLILVIFSLIVIIDLEHRLILHPVNLVGALSGFLIGIRLHGPAMTLLGGIAGYGIMLVLYWFGELFSAYLARRRGNPVDEVALGFGDVNLGGGLGLLLGWPGIAAGLLIAILAGGIVSALFLLTMVARRQYRALTALPYAPFLVFAAAALLFRP